jgi:SSS family solute:Na+ symporter
MGAILYLLCLAISGMTGWNIFILIAVIGLVTITYTFFGGIEGVVWSDVIQGLLLMGGGILSLIFILLKAPGGAQSVIQASFQYDKFKLASFSWDPQNAGFFVLVIFGLNYFFQKYMSDQTVVQRYLLSPSKKQACRALWISSSLIMFVWVLFMVIGALLWGFYKIQPDLLPMSLRSQPDQVFPYFIGHQLPSGLSGLILAGLMAATMSTLSSDLNSLGSVLFDDYYSRLNKVKNDSQKLLFSRMSVLVSGLLSILLAMSMTRIHSMADAAFNFVSLLAGGVLGMYMLGMFTRRGSKRGLYTGIFVGILIILWAYLNHPDRSLIPWLPEYPLHTLWIGLIGNITVLVTGYVASRVLTPHFQGENDLTIYSK